MKTVFTKTEIYQELQNLAIKYIQEHPGYLFARGSYSEAEFVLQPVKAFERCSSYGSENVYFTFEKVEDNWDCNSYQLKVFTNRVYDKVNKVYNQDYIYVSEIYYPLDAREGKYVKDKSIREDALKVRYDRWNARHYENSKVDKVFQAWTITDRVLNAKLLAKIERLTGKVLKDQQLKIQKHISTYKDDPEIIYNITYCYRKNNYYVSSKVMHDWGWDDNDVRWDTYKTVIRA